MIKRTFKSIIAFLLVATTLFGATVSVFAATGEEYISELRLVYADDYDEAKAIIADSEFKDYKILKKNLNEGTDKIGVWLAYKVTTNIEEAITDLSVMQMNGGYHEGNYAEMIAASREEYEYMAGYYLDAINYWKTALKAGDFLANSAFRQLNFYTGLDDYKGELLGDLLVKGLDTVELGVLFLEGNSYALDNIRSLIAMGVSYNADGNHYLQKVAEEAAKVTADPSVYNGKNYDYLAAMIAPTIEVLRELFEELEAYEDELDYLDEDITDLELELIENKGLAEMTREVNYLEGMTLYEFCLDYRRNESDYSSIYPLVAAMNPGQTAMTRVAHYYDVLRYSMTDYPEEMINEELDRMEATYGEKPFDVYSGVDRSIYKGTFAFTNEAYRADAYGEGDSLEEFWGTDQIVMTAVNMSINAVGGGIYCWAAIRHLKELTTANTAYIKAQVAEIVAKIRSAHIVNKIGNQSLSNGTQLLSHAGDSYFYFTTYNEFLDGIITHTKLSLSGLPANPTFADKYYYIAEAVRTETLKLEPNTLAGVNRMIKHINRSTKGLQTGKETATTATKAAAVKMSGFTAALYVVGGAMMIYSACSIIHSIYSYYNPDYDDIPIAIVDIVDTVDGDRYIKYDVVYEAETRGSDKYAPADLNAYDAQRWNALYYTKSYEAGKPLLANAFVVSNTSNKPKTGYMAVHRFGEVICYNLNKFNFKEDTSIYLSVKQSKNQKSAVTDVPEVVGSMFSAGFLILAGGIGAVAGVGGTVATYEIIKKKKRG